MNRKCTGIWVRIEIFELMDQHPKLKLVHALILAQIDLLGKAGNPCRISNAYFSNLLKVSISTVSRAISLLHELGLISILQEVGKPRELLSKCFDNLDKKTSRQNGEQASQNDKGFGQNEVGASQFDNHKESLNKHKRILEEYSLKGEKSIENLEASFQKKGTNSTKQNLPTRQRKPPPLVQQSPSTFLESVIGKLENFKQAFEGTDYMLADLDFYFEKVNVWASDGKKNRNWIGVAKNFMLNDRRDGKLLPNKKTRTNEYSIIDHEQAKRVARKRMLQRQFDENGQGRNGFSYTGLFA